MYCMEERWKKGQYQQDDVGRVGEGFYEHEYLGQQRKEPNSTKEHGCNLIKMLLYKEIHFV